MRHHTKTRTLHRDRKQRTALLRSLARSLVLHEAIETTVAKAKELRPFIEKMVTTSKTNTVAARRNLKDKLFTADVLKKLFMTLAPRYKDRMGGYTRIVHLGRVGKRVGEQARIEFVQ